MSRRVSRAAALVAILAIAVAMPLAGPRACDVCPADCPMHAARQGGPERRLGCHQGTTTHASATRDAAGCAMRATCGHHDDAAPAGFQAVLASRPRVRLALCAVPAAGAVPAPPALRALEPPTDPPRLLPV